MMRNRKGSALIELAIVAPILVLIALGVADFGRVFLTAITVTHAAKAGAQYGAQDVTTSANFAAINQFVRADASPTVLDSVKSSSTCRCSSGVTPPGGCSGSCPGYGAVQVFLTVRAKKTVTTFFRYPGLPRTIPVSRNVIFRVQ
jgi:Flp pilus assembly protein TadG